MKATQIILMALLFAWPIYASSQNNKTSNGISSDFHKKASEYLTQRVRINKFSGVVLVAVNGKPVLTAAYGVANHEFGTPNVPEIKFRIGSAGKQFTASAILLLEQRGQLKVTDPVSKYLPDWPKAWAEITVHHLLSHTSGLPSLSGVAPFTDVSNLVNGFYNPSFYKSVKDLYKPGEELMAPGFKPGEEFDYSNFGYIILGFIIEKVSGKSFCDFLQKEFFTPLKMNDTRCENPDLIVKQRASGYILKNDSIFNSGFVDLRFEAPAGGEYSTVNDLLRWNNSLETNQILSGEETRKLFVPNKANYGYGWWNETKFDQPIQWHRGTVAGFAAILVRYPQKKLFIVILSNIQRTQVKAISTELAAIAFGEHYEMPGIHQEIPLDSLKHNYIIGKYCKANNPSDCFRIVNEKNQLYVKGIDNSYRFEIFPESKEKFFAKWGEYYLDFQQFKERKITIRNDGESSIWQKIE